MKRRGIINGRGDKAVYSPTSEKAAPGILPPDCRTENRKGNRTAARLEEAIFYFPAIPEDF
jgi:hypothetical protein